MSEITIPYHLAIPVIISILALLIIFFQRQKLFKEANRKWFWISIIVFISVYLFIVGSSLIDDIYCKWDMNRYDLDKDGFFGGKEMTKEQEAAMQNLTNDLGRNLSFITGLITSSMISLLVFIIGRGSQIIRKN